MSSNPLPKGWIAATFEDVRLVLEREGFQDPKQLSE
jgi:hypothetical protein